MNHVDVQYIHLISPRLEKFVKKKDYLYNFRCPYCGDSSKNKNRARGFFFQKNSDMIYKCHNCGVGRSLANFLKDNALDLYDQYLLERFKNGTTGRGTNTKTPTFDFPKPQFITKKDSIFKDLTSIESLNTTHPAKEYLHTRKIPEKYFSNFYYVDDFNVWSKSKSTIKEPRIILPLISEDGNVFGYQARSLKKNATLRYITTILDKQYPKLFGLDRINKNETVYITEGPFDSLFICNSIAMCGADVHLGDWGINDPVWIYDNEPRNQQIVSRISCVIGTGQKVVIWPSSIKEKDINDMVLSGYDVQSIIESNTYSGLEAKVKLTEWKRV